LINITLCDDSANDIEIIKSELIKYSTDKHIKFNISSFNSPDQLIYEIQDRHISDIFILDVSMPGKNGFELAEAIRQHIADPVIIFLTSMEGRAVDGYKVNALRYVIKENLSRDITEALDCAVKAVSNSNDSVITVRRYNDFWRVSYDSIIYVTRVSRQLIIVTDKDGELVDNRGISEFFNILNDDRFIFIDRGCFVNIDYISQIIGNDIRLKNGSVLPISRRLMKTVKETLLIRWGL